MSRFPIQRDGKAYIAIGRGNVDELTSFHVLVPIVLLAIAIVVAFSFQPPLPFMGKSSKITDSPTPNGSAQLTPPVKAETVKTKKLEKPEGRGDKSAKAAKARQERLVRERKRRQAARTSSVDDSSPAPVSSPSRTSTATRTESSPSRQPPSASRPTSSGSGSTSPSRPSAPSTGGVATAPSSSSGGGAVSPPAATASTGVCSDDTPQYCPYDVPPGVPQPESQPAG